MKTQFNLTTCACDLDRFEDQQALLRLMHGFDGVELMCFEDDARGIVPRERVIGLHMNCLTYWLDFWEGRLDACVQELDSMENVRRMYGGDTREALLAHYRRDLENAKKYGAEYVVFHVTDASIPETLRYRFHRTDAEVIDASCELLNLLFDGVTDGPALLLENLWEPGLTMTDPEMTARLLDGVRYANKGIMLDTGHLMHTQPALQNQRQALSYIHTVLDRHGELCKAIRGVHLQQSITGRYMRRIAKNPPEPAADYSGRSYQLFEYVFRVDQHKPFTCAGVPELIARIAPEYLTFEFISNDLPQLRRMLHRQQNVFQKKT